MAIETPKYKVLQKDNKIEVRQYLGYINATVNVESDSHSSAGSQGFGYLANYIFGGNKVEQKISMTAPVSSTKQEKTNKYVISFTMPSKYSLDTLPKPKNDDVVLEKIEKYEAVAIKFSGYTAEPKLQKKISELKSWAKEHNLNLSGEPIISRFDPPWTPGFLRHNEISIKIK